MIGSLYNYQFTKPKQDIFLLLAKDDLKTALAKTAIKSLIKYGLNPKLAKKKKRRQFSKETRNKVLKRQRGMCNICRKPLDVVEFDHINGNTYDNHYLNCQALCPNCHAKKSRHLRRLKNRRFY